MLVSILRQNLPLETPSNGIICYKLLLIDHNILILIKIFEFHAQSYLFLQKPITHQGSVRFVTIFYVLNTIIWNRCC